MGMREREGLERREEEREASAAAAPATDAIFGCRVL